MLLSARANYPDRVHRYTVANGIVVRISISLCLWLRYRLEDSVAFSTVLHCCELVVSSRVSNSRPHKANRDGKFNICLL
jgi:hypothetical protein